MRIDNRIAAFTLFEVVIAMLIAALVLSVTYTAFTLVYSSYLNYTRKQDQLALFHSMDFLLKNDLKHAELVKLRDKGIVMTSAGDTICYRFSDTLIIREHNRLLPDTFKLSVLLMETQFEGREPSSEVIDMISFQTIVDGEQLKLHYYKIYSSANLFE